VTIEKVPVNAADITYRQNSYVQNMNKAMQDTCFHNSVMHNLL
jgi:hypothetical protein